METERERWLASDDVMRSQRQHFLWTWINNN